MLKHRCLPWVVSALCLIGLGCESEEPFEYADCAALMSLAGYPGENCVERDTCGGRLVADDCSGDPEATDDDVTFLYRKSDKHPVGYIKAGPDRCIPQDFVDCGL